MSNIVYIKEWKEKKNKPKAMALTVVPTPPPPPPKEFTPWTPLPGSTYSMDITNYSEPKYTLVVIKAKPKV